MVYHPTDSLTVRLFARVGGRSFLPTPSLAGSTLVGGILMEKDCIDYIVYVGI